jgi:hypothetical protein
MTSAPVRGIRNAVRRLLLSARATALSWAVAAPARRAKEPRPDNVLAVKALLPADIGGHEGVPVSHARAKRNAGLIRVLL